MLDKDARYRKLLTVLLEEDVEALVDQWIAQAGLGYGKAYHQFPILSKKDKVIGYADIIYPEVGVLIEVKRPFYRGGKPRYLSAAYDQTDLYMKHLYDTGMAEGTWSAIATNGVRWATQRYYNGKPEVMFRWAELELEELGILIEPKLLVSEIWDWMVSDDWKEERRKEREGKRYGTEKYKDWNRNRMRENRKSQEYLDMEAARKRERLRNDPDLHARVKDQQKAYRQKLKQRQENG